MGSVILFNAERMQEIEDGTVVSGLVDISGNLILEKHDGSNFNAGYVVGPVGPTGAVVAFAGDVLPLGWFWCNGAVKSRVSDSSLFSVVGTKYGIGDGSTTYGLPNLKGRVIVGFDPSQTKFDTLGEIGGENEHTLTVSELASHNHTQDSHNHTQNSHNHTQDSHNHTQNSHTHSSESGTYWIRNGGGSGAGAATGGAFAQSTTTGAATATNQAATATNQAATATNQAATATNQAAGGGSAHNNLQPFMVMNYIIKS